MSNFKIGIFLGVLVFSLFYFEVQPAAAGTCSRRNTDGTTSCTTVSDPNQCAGGDWSESGVCGNSGGFGAAGGFARDAAAGAGVDTQSTLESKVASIVNYALSLIGLVFLLLMVYGGYIWMMARGDEGEAKRAKDIITMGVIGMAIVIAAYAITFFIVQRLVAGAA